MELIFRNYETVAARWEYTHQLSSLSNGHPIEYFVYCPKETVKFALPSWFSIVRGVWWQKFSVLNKKKPKNISIVSSHFYFDLRVSALRLPTVLWSPTNNRCFRVQYSALLYCCYSCDHVCLKSVCFPSRLIWKLARPTIWKQYAILAWHQWWFWKTINCWIYDDFGKKLTAKDSILPTHNISSQLYSIFGLFDLQM